MLVCGVNYEEFHRAKGCQGGERRQGKRGCVWLKGIPLLALP
jgi:hypothetical protein